jgi:hypothetical protein
MAASLKDVKEVHRVFLELETEYRVANKSLFRLELLNLELKHEIEMLRKEIQFKDVTL